MSTCTRENEVGSEYLNLYFSLVSGFRFYAPLAPSTADMKPNHLSSTTLSTRRYFEPSKDEAKGHGYNAIKASYLKFLPMADLGKERQQIQVEVAHQVLQKSVPSTN